MKICKKCNIPKEFKLFSKCIKSKDKLSYWCKECIKNKINDWKLLNPDYNKKWNDLNPNYTKDYYNNKKSKKFIPQTKEQQNQRINNYYKLKRKNDPLYQFSSNLRVRIYQAFKRQSWKKGGNTELLIGCTFDEAKKHIETQFLEGMNWNNQGKWHIDHKIPLISATSKEELKTLCCYKNLQPLWALDNLKKGAK